MEHSIHNLLKQFAWEPNIENESKWKRHETYLLVGMGGSHLQGDIFQTIAPGFNLSVHQDYGLPPWPLDTLKKTLVIASSYSGNTEETLSAFQEAVERRIPVAALSIGGKLLTLAKEQTVPYVQIPDTGIQPRAALGFTFKALAKLVGRDDIVHEAAALTQRLEASDLEKEGKELAETLRGKIPVIYASNKNYSIAYNWKIKFNETAKIPAFYNLFPELNHNEMTGFDVVDSTRSLSEKFSFLFLKDSDDHPRIQKRMGILQGLFDERGLPVRILELREGSRLSKVFSSLLLGDWVSYHLAEYYGVEPEQVPMVEEFKKLMQRNN